MINPPTDINEQVEVEWIETTTPFERILAVMKHMYEAESADEIADRAHTTPVIAHEHLHHLTESGFVRETSQSGRKETLYKRSSESLLLERANRILSEVNGDTLVTRVSEMQDELHAYRNEHGADSPEDAVLMEANVDQSILQEWQTTRRNLNFARVALALDQAKRDLEATQRV